MNRESLIARVDHRVIRPFLASVLRPEDYVKVYSLARIHLLDMLASSEPHAYAPSNPVEVWGLKFRSDVGNAAGMDKDGRNLDFVEVYYDKSIF